MAEPPLSTLRRPLLVAAGLLVLLAPGPPPAGAAPPWLATVFRVEAPSFQPLAAQTTLAADVADLLAARLGDRFGYLGWPKTGERDGTPAASLVLRLFAETQQPDWPPRIRLGYVGRLGEREFALSGLDDETLYESWDPQPTQDAAQLATDLRQRIEARVGGDVFQRALESGLLSKVALIDRLELDQGQKLVVLPMRWSELRAARESVLGVEFAARQGEAAALGNLELSPEVPLLDPRWHGQVQCVVQRFSFGPTLIVEPTKWDDQIGRVLRPPALQKLTVFMKRYVPEIGPGLGDGLATEP